jgi:hypothetical protein
VLAFMPTASPTQASGGTWEEGLERITSEAYVASLAYAKCYVWARELECSSTSDESPPFLPTGGIEVLPATRPDDAIPQ